MVGCLVLALVSLTGCLGSGFAIDAAKSSVENDDESSSTSTTSTVASINPCSSYDSSNPKKAYCSACVAKLLEENCPSGVSNASECPDAAFRNTFVNQVNLCISASTAAGTTCTRTCGSGLTLNRSTCQCETSSSSGTGAAGSGLTDQGAIDSGPPVVTMQWNAGLKTQTVETGGGGQDTSTAFRGVQFSVRNRGLTSASANTYSILGTDCDAGGPEIAATSFANGINSGAAPVAYFTATSTGKEYGRKEFFFDANQLDSTVTTYDDTLRELNGSSAYELKNSTLIGNYIRNTAVGGNLSLNLESNAGTQGIDPGYNGLGSNLNVYAKVLFLDEWDGTADLDISRGAANLLPNHASYSGGLRPSNLSSITETFVFPRFSLFSTVTSATSYFSSSRLFRNTDIESANVGGCTSAACIADGVVELAWHNLASSASNPDTIDLSVTDGGDDARVGIASYSVWPTEGHPRCSIQYQFRDSTSQSSYYCLVFEVRTVCGTRKNGLSGCVVEPVPTANPFFQVVDPNTACL